MCAQCEELREEVEFLRRELGIQRSEDRENQLSLAFGLTGKQAHLLSILYSRPGSSMTQGALWEALYSDSHTEPEMKIVDIFICQIRKKLPKGAIETIWGRGYRLAPVGVQACDAAVAAVLSETTAANALKERRGRRSIRDGVTAQVLRILADGPKNAQQVGAALPESQRPRAASILSTATRDGRAKRKPGRHPGEVSKWSITQAGKDYLAALNEATEERIAA